MRRFLLVLSVTSTVCLLSLPAPANVFNLGPGLTNLETVLVGDPGNAADTAGHSGNPAGQGSVAYTYRIGKYEVTAGQYCAFLNAVAATDIYGLYNTNMWSASYGCKIQRSGSSGSYGYSIAADWANRPVNYVSYWDACRFANWLSNGQPVGAQCATTTERGTYTLDGYNGDSSMIQRNANWIWAVTGEDEWYKAAYYKGGGADAGYWLFPTRSDSIPSNQLANPDPGNSATWHDNGYTIGSPYFRTEVGAHKNSGSAYGTFDQAGNTQEWTEGIHHAANRGIRGGSAYVYGSQPDVMQSTYRHYRWQTYEDFDTGFRVSAPIPEPSGLMILAGGLASLLGLRKRRP